MKRIAAAVVLAAISTAAAANHQKVVLLGLPKSGSYRIHQFIQCMNQNQKVHNIPENDASSSSQQQQQHPITTTVLSSAHYCCDPHRSENNSHHHDDENEDKDEASFFFPCPTHMIPCGTCMHDYYNRNHHHHHHDDDSNATTTTTTSWMEHCGNYNVYTNFHVEATTGDGDYTFFLPQHFALAHLVGDESRPDDERNTNSTTTTTWIYHHRATAAQWATHVAHWYSITHRLLHAFGVPYYYYYENHEPEEVAWTLDDLQHELDTTSMERLHNQTDQQRRYIELVAIHDHFQNTIQQFVHDYNNHRHDDDEDDPPRHHHQIQLYDINIDDDNDDDDSTNTPGTLARALGYDDINMAAARSCWSTTDAPNDTDYQDFQLTTTFRASA
jgi:hypothetical protein